MSVVVQLSKFEGPLALLLYLIRKDEMDIFDIKINEITTQYLDYIKMMKELDLEVAGEFVAMAATLIQIKSKMLLPQYDEKGEVIENEDPRKELVQKLLEYQKFQEAARLLYERPLVGRDMWTRGTRLNLDEPTEEIEVEENGLFTMISLYRQIMRSAKKRIHQVTAKAQSIAGRILEIKDMLTMGSRKTLNELVVVSENRMRQVLITFLSVLELAKLGFVGLYQTETYGDIWIDLRKPIENDVVSRVEEYDSIDNKADALFAKAEQDAQLELTAGDAEEFVLKDSEDRLEEEENVAINPEDMASDDEILQAEMELAGQISEVVVEIPVMTEVEADIVDDQIAMAEMAAEETPVTEEVVHFEQTLGMASIEEIESEEAVSTREPVEEDAALVAELQSAEENQIIEENNLSEEAPTEVLETVSEAVIEEPTDEVVIGDEWTNVDEVTVVAYEEQGADDESGNEPDAQI